MRDEALRSARSTKTAVRVERISDIAAVAYLRRSEDRPWPTDLSTWLQDAERQELSRFRSPTRRIDWLNGRWCARNLLRSSFPGDEFEMKDWQILTGDSNGAGQRPRIMLRQIPQTFHLSISHSDSLSVAAISTHKSVRIGIDTVKNQVLPKSFELSWFVDDERRRVHQTGWTFAACWAAKEAAFKTCNCGEPFRPRSIRVLQIENSSCIVQYQLGLLITVNVQMVYDSFVALATLHAEPSATDGQLQKHAAERLA